MIRDVRRTGVPTYGHAVDDWWRLPWRVHRAYANARTAEALAKVRADAAAWLRDVHAAERASVVEPPATRRAA